MAVIVKLLTLVEVDDTCPMWLSTQSRSQFFLHFTGCAQQWWISRWKKIILRL